MTKDKFDKLAEEIRIAVDAYGSGSEELTVIVRFIMDKIRTAHQEGVREGRLEAEKVYAKTREAIRTQAERKE